MERREVGGNISSREEEKKTLGSPQSKREKGGDMVTDGWCACVCSRAYYHGAHPSAFPRDARERERKRKRREDVGEGPGDS